MEGVSRKHWFDLGSGWNSTMESGAPHVVGSLSFCF